MLKRKPYRPAVLYAAVLFAAFLAGIPAALCAAGDDPEAGFAELYARILHAVDSGRMEKSMARKARAINTSLQKEVLAIDERISALKTASAKAEGARQEELLDELVELGSRRERAFSVHRRQLEQLVGGREGDAALSARPANTAVIGERPDDDTPAPTKRAILFENVPEDISTGQFD